MRILKIGQVGLIAASALMIGCGSNLADTTASSNAMADGSSSFDDKGDEHSHSSFIMDDYALDMDELNAQNDSVQQGAKGFTVYKSTAWTGGIIPVKFDVGIDSTKQAKIFAQCAIWSQYAKIKCVKYTTQAKFLLVTTKDKTNCYANVGMGSSAGTRVLNLGLSWCWTYNWSILHELGHTMGLMHEHQRKDRNTYIQVLTGNILPGYSSMFNILSGSQNITTYDFRSIMHYPSYSYAVSGKKSMIARPAYAANQKYLDVQPTVLSSGDISSIRNIYGAK